jgi:hypothetical protein
VKPLSIDKALRLYKLIAPYLPEVSETDTGADFIGKIIESIKDSGKHRDYVEIVALMIDTTVETLIHDLQSDEILSMFVEGLTDNKILFLQEFCKKVGFNG